MYSHSATLCRHKFIIVLSLVGMMLENYIHTDLRNINITLLAGDVLLYSPETKKNITLPINQAISVGTGTHKVREINTQDVVCGDNFS